MTPHLIVHHLLQRLSSESEQSTGHGGVALALLLGASKMAEVALDSWLSWVTSGRIQFPMQATLNSMVYRKALCLPNAADGAGQGSKTSIFAQMRSSR